MQELINYAFLAADKVKRDQALGDYENLKKDERIQIVSNEEAIQRLKNFKYKLETLISRLPDNLMIAGSTALACVVKDYDINPHNIIIYMNENDHNTVAQIDRAICETYNNTEIILMRTQYTINWFLKDNEKESYPVFQLFLTPVRHWSEVFASSHSDLDCIGFETSGKKFIYGKGRFDTFCETAICNSTTSFTDEKYKQRVLDEIDKYHKYGFEINVVSAQRVITKTQIEASPTVEIRSLFEETEEFIHKHPQVLIGKYLHNIYFGEVFKDYIEVFSMFNRCPICDTLIAEQNVCDSCSKAETRQVIFVKEILKNSNPDLKYLIIGEQCGLGNEIAKMLLDCGRDVTVTSRYPKPENGKKVVELDLKDSKSVTEFEKEVGNYDILILADYVPDSEDIGIWHKRIEKLSNEEIEGSIRVNVTSITKIFRSFVAYQIKHKPANQKSIIYLTSSEGAFMDKSPFLPVTNLAKSAMEQVICTFKRQADVIGMNIVMADPGFTYTNSTSKNVGPVGLEWGAAQVLSPLAGIISGKDVKNGSLWSRKNKDLCLIRDTNEFSETKFTGDGETCSTMLNDTTNVMIILEPCGHKVGLSGWLEIRKSSRSNTKCPTCRISIKNTQITTILNNQAEEEKNEFDAVQGNSKQKDKSSKTSKKTEWISVESQIEYMDSEDYLLRDLHIARGGRGWGRGGRGWDRRGRGWFRGGRVRGRGQYFE